MGGDLDQMEDRHYLKIAVRSLLCIAGLSLALLSTPPAQAEEDILLDGGISYIRMDANSKNRPTWMKGSVYSTKDMVLKVFRKAYLPFASTTIKSIIPEYTNSSVRLRKRVLAHWHGYLPGSSCRVTTVPISEHGDFQGGFEFHHFNPQGPKGYLQRIGRDKEGFMQYRIWFVDQVASAET